MATVLNAVTRDLDVHGRGQEAYVSGFEPRRLRKTHLTITSAAATASPSALSSDTSSAVVDTPLRLRASASASERLLLADVSAV